MLYLKCLFCTCRLRGAGQRTTLQNFLSCCTQPAAPACTEIKIKRIFRRTSPIGIDSGKQFHDLFWLAADIAAGTMSNVENSAQSTACTTAMDASVALFQFSGSKTPGGTTLFPLFACRQPSRHLFHYQGPGVLRKTNSLDYRESRWSNALCLASMDSKEVRRIPIC